MLRRISEESKEVGQELDENILTELCCPIDFEPLNDFVIGSDGFFYNRKAIETHLQNNPHSPFTRQLLQLHNPSKEFQKKIHSIIEEAKAKSNETRLKLKKADDTLIELNAEIKKLQQDLQQAKKKLDDLEKSKQQKPHEIKPIEFKTTVIEPVEQKVSSRVGPLKQSWLNSSFLKAIRGRDIALARYYASEHADINAVDANGDSALIIATMLRGEYPEIALKIMSMLCMELKCDVNKKGFIGCTALHRAASLNDASAVRFLLSQKADPFIISDKNETPFMHGLIVNKDQFSKEVMSLFAKAEQDRGIGNGSYRSTLFSFDHTHNADLVAAQKNMRKR